MNIAINGFGRIGRNFLRAILANRITLEKVQVKVINIGPARKDMVAHMFQYDSLMGTYQGKVSVTDNRLVVDGYSIELLAEPDPSQIPWSRYAIDWVVECSGRFARKDKAMLHVHAGAKKVLVSAPCKDADVTIIPGINQHDYKAHDHSIVSLGSCTTNAFVPMVYVLQRHVGLVSGTMTTVHAYTNSQVLLDVEAKDERRSRAAALNIIPTSTGTSELIGVIIPELSGAIHAMALRVPVAKVSLVDFSFITHHPLRAEQINSFFDQESKGALKGIVSVTDKPLVSSDFSGDSHSVIIDGLSTSINGTLGKVLGWYDNEWAYSCRLKDFLAGLS